MKDLQIITNSFTPAKVDFNYEQISKQLDVLLEKYEGLVFTEVTVGECKKTIAELRKGQRSLDDFRKKTKKKLTESVTEFENDCKKLYKKFDTVIDPLTEQADVFEEQRREEKRKQVQKIVDKIIEKQGLNEKYAGHLTIQDQYLNKSKTIKSIKEELIETAENLGVQQDKEEADKELIKARIELVNVKCGVDLQDTNYIRLLEYEDIAEVLEKITADGETLKEKREAPVVQAPPVQPVQEIPTPKEDEEIFVEKYEIEGTSEQLDALEDYLDKNFSTWKVLND